MLQQVTQGFVAVKLNYSVAIFDLSIVADRIGPLEASSR